jgi:hypothetical protein
MDNDAKIRPLYLLRILKERTDEEHTLTTSEICRILSEEYGLNTFRTTVKSDVEVLQKAGFDIQVNRSTQNHYCYIDRDFDLPELRLLIDAVLSSKFITKKKSEQLVIKLMEQAGPFHARDLNRNQFFFRQCNSSAHLRMVRRPRAKIILGFIPVPTHSVQFDIPPACRG